VTYQALDEQTFDRMIQALDRAHRGGLHPVEVLHRSGLVLSPEAERAIKVATLEYVLEEIRAWTPAEFLRRMDMKGAGATPGDMYMSICGYIEDLISVARKEPHGSAAG
jgi:hypothetical protein